MPRSRMLVLCGAALFLLALGGAAPKCLSDKVKFESGTISGIMVNSDVQAFIGIPFAAPPVEPLPVALPARVEFFERFFKK